MLPLRISVHQDVIQHNEVVTGRGNLRSHRQTQAEQQLFLCPLRKMLKCDHAFTAYPEAGDLQMLIEKNTALVVARNLRECCRQPRFEWAEHRACGGLLSKLD